MPHRIPRSNGSSRQIARIGSRVRLACLALVGACASERASAPDLIGAPPASPLRALAFTADVNTRTGAITITAPGASTANVPTLSRDGIERPGLSLLGGDAVRLVASNYRSSAVGEFEPNKIRVTFDVAIENKLSGVRMVTPTWPVPSATGVILVPIDNTVTATPGGVTGNDGSTPLIELPRTGTVAPSIDFNGTGAVGSGAPYDFFNDAACAALASSDCFRWEAYDAQIEQFATSSTRTVGYDIDASVGQFLARLIVAADLAPTGQTPVNPRPLHWRNVVQAFDAGNNTQTIQVVYDLSANLPETFGPEALASFVVDSLTWNPSALQFQSMNLGPGIIGNVDQSSVVAGRFRFRGATTPGLDGGILVLAVLRFRPVGPAGSATTTATFLGDLIGTPSTGGYSYGPKTTITEATVTIP